MSMEVFIVVSSILLILCTFGKNITQVLNTYESFTAALPTNHDSTDSWKSYFLSKNFWFLNGFQMLLLLLAIIGMCVYFFSPDTTDYIKM